MSANVTHVSIPAALFDVSGAYSWSFSIQNLWRFVIAESVGVSDVTEEIRPLDHLESLVEGLTNGVVPFESRAVLVRLIATGSEILPTKPVRDGRARLILAPTDLSGAANWWWLSDVLAGVALGGQFPKQIVAAMEFVPRDVRADVQPIHLPTGRVVDPYQEDVVRAIREERDRLRDEVDPDGLSRRNADLLRLLGTTLTFGNMARVDRSTVRRAIEEVIIGPDGARLTIETTHPEQPGPHFNFMIAGAVTARVRLAMAASIAGLHESGGTWLHVATDSLLIAVTDCAKPEFVPCPGGPVRHRKREGVLALPVNEITELLARTGAPWRAQRGHDQRLTGHVVGTNRYAVVGRDRESSTATESGLGGVYADPTGTNERTSDEHWKWAVDAHLAVARSEASWNGRGELPKIELPSWGSLPAVRLGVANTAEQLDRLATVFPERRIRPFTRFMTAVLDPLQGDKVTVLSLDVELPPTKWLGAHWVNAATGESVVLSTGQRPRSDTYRVRTYAELIDAWRRTDDSSSEPVSPQDHVLQRGLRRTLPVVSRAELVELVGKEGDDLLRQLDDPLAVPDDDLTIYRRADRWKAIQEAAERLGSEALATRSGLNLRTAQRVVKGERVSDATMARVSTVIEDLGDALGLESSNTCTRPGCGRRITAGRKWCSESCRKKAERGRDAVDLVKVGAVRCTKCEAVTYGKKAKPCPSCGGKGVIEARTDRCPECGVERIGATEGPCPLCEKGRAS